MTLVSSASAASWYYYPCEGWGQREPFAGLPELSQQLIYFSLPFLVLISQDDSPQIYPTSPGPVPITLAVDHVLVKRRDDGVFYLTGQKYQEMSFILQALLGGSALLGLILERRLELKCDGKDALVMGINVMGNDAGKDALCCVCCP